MFRSKNQCLVQRIDRVHFAYRYSYNSNTSAVDTTINIECKSRLLCMYSSRASRDYATIRVNILNIALDGGDYGGICGVR